MITTSIAHMLQATLQYTALVTILLLSQWIKGSYQDIRRTLTARTSYSHHSARKGRRGQDFFYEKRLCILYQWVRRFRQEHHLTQEALAELLEVDPRTIQRWEEEGTRPQPRHSLKFQKLRERLERPIPNYPIIPSCPCSCIPPYLEPRMPLRAFRRALLVLLCLGIFVTLILVLVFHFWR